MGVRFNTFTGNFDLTGSGGGGGASYIDGEVATYSDLPLDGTAALNSAWLVRSASGVWPVSRKQAGIYIRTATAGSSRDADYTYAGTMPDVFSDANFTIYDDADTSKNLKFQLSGLATGTTSTLTVPASGTIARTEDFAAPPAIGSTTASSGAFTTLSASTSLTLGTSGILSGGTNTIEQRNTTSAQTFRIYNTVSGAADANYERGFIGWSSNTLRIGTEKAGTGSARALEFQTDGTTRLTLASTGLATFSGSVIAGGSGFSTNSTITLSTNFIMSAQSTAATLNCVSNPSAIRLFGLGADASTNTERLHISTRTGASYFISTQATGTGTVRALELRTNDVARLTIEAAGGLTVADANDIAVGTTTGTKIGTATTQKIGFFNATPVTQRAAIADATDAATTQARLNDLLAAMRSLGLIAT